MMQNKVYLAAVTGGIGSGKSVVLERLRALGARTLSADVLNAELLKRSDYIEKIGKAFENAVKDGAVDKKALASIVFSDKTKLEQLNNIAKPELSALIKERIEKESVNGDLIFVECPLLYEWGLEDNFDAIIVVTAPIADRIDRVRLRDGRDESEISSIIASQTKHDASGSEKEIVIANDSDIQALYQKADKAYADIKEKAKSHKKK